MVQCIYIVPSDPPTNIVLNVTSPFMLTMEWESPNVPNGVITYYTIYLQYDDEITSIISVSGNTTTFSLSDLQPYTLVRLQVSANTSAGEGPLSTVRETRTAQSSKNNCFYT